MASDANSGLRASWRELMAAHARISDALDRELQRGHGLSLTEFEVLQRLAESPDGHQRMQELAEEIHLSPSALSRLVGRLERTGLVERDICEEDRRGIYACLTAAGRETHDRAEPTHRGVLAQNLA